MSSGSRGEITQLLIDLRDRSLDGSGPSERLFRAVYDEMRRMADRLMRREAEGHTLQPTALVHEAYLKLVDQTRVEWQDRNHFLATAARVMRHILVDHARTKSRQKRGQGWQRITLDESLGISGDPYLDTESLDRALTRLSGLDERMGRVAELRIFGGLTSEELAGVLGVCKRTVDGDWMVARRWLANEIAA